MVGITRGTGNSGGIYSSLAQLQASTVPNNRRVELVTGERYQTSSSNEGSGLLLASGNFANPISATLGQVESVHGRIGDVVAEDFDYSSLQIAYDPNRIVPPFGTFEVQGTIEAMVDSLRRLESGAILKGSWDALNNLPDIGAGAPISGDYWVVSVSGNTSLGGITDWVVGDWALFTGGVWSRVQGSEALTSANTVVYDNSSSTLVAVNSQDAFDELDSKIENLDSTEVTYDNTVSGLSAINVKEALDELSLGFGDIFATDVTYDPSTSGMTSDNTQDAIDELRDIVGTAVGVEEAPNNGVAYSRFNENWSPYPTQTNASTVLPQVGGGTITAAGFINQIRDSDTYIVPLALSVPVDTMLVVEVPDRYSDQTPSIIASGSDTFINSQGVDTTVTWVGASRLTLTSDGISEWSVSEIGSSGPTGPAGPEGPVNPLSDDSQRLGGELPEYYATQAEVDGIQTDTGDLNDQVARNKIFALAGMVL